MNKYAVVGAWQADDDVASFCVGVNAKSESEAINIVTEAAKNGSLMALFFGEFDSFGIEVDIYERSVFAVAINDIEFLA